MELVPYLLKLLEGIGLETLDNPSATKAQIVKALKSMTRSLQYGEQVRSEYMTGRIINSSHEIVGTLIVKNDIILLFKTLCRLMRFLQSLQCGVPSKTRNTTSSSPSLRPQVT